MNRTSLRYLFAVLLIVSIGQSIWLRTIDQYRAYGWSAHTVGSLIVGVLWVITAGVWLLKLVQTAEKYDEDRGRWETLTRRIAFLERDGGDPR